MGKRNERGSFTLEAILALSIFMFAYIALASLSAVAKVESATQYAIDQVAKEISQYYYIVDRAGLVKIDPDGAKPTEAVENAIGGVFDFVNTAKDIADQNSGNNLPNGIPDFSSALDSLDKVSNDVKSISDAAQNMYTQLGPALSDPKGTISCLTAMLKSDISRTIVSRIIAQPLCRALTPKYIVSNGEADEALEKMGVIGGLGGLDFGMSSFLADGRSINVVVIYQLKVNGFGVFDRTLLIMQTASTAAWVTGTSMAEAVESSSLWSLSSLDRGKAFVAMLKEENGSKAVAPGRGIDLYDQASNTFTEIYSVNVFMKSYSEYASTSDDPASASNYSLKESAIKSLVKKYANTLLGHINKIDIDLTMEDGRTVQTNLQNRSATIILIAPVEAKENAESLAILNRVASQIQSETGVTVQWTYREEALQEGE